jgi:hypothetical protein
MKKSSELTGQLDSRLRGNDVPLLLPGTLKVFFYKTQ